MYITKVKISSEWQSLLSLIQEQTPGFAFGTDTYQLQAEGPFGARFVDASAAPTASIEGIIIAGTQVAMYKVDTGTLYVKAEQDVPAGQWLKISKLS